MPVATTPRKKSRRTRSKASTSSPSAGLPDLHELDLFAAFCRDVLTLEDGSPFVLQDFQRRMLTDLFAGKRETVILIPKKNGKTTLLGALALFHLCTTPDAECVIAAASRDQAGIMLRQAQGFIRRAPSLQMRLQVKQREIVHEGLNGRIRILASDVDTTDGIIPTLGLIDELHRHKNSELYGIFRDGLGPRGGKMVTISTAGDDQESPLGNLRRVAYAQRGMVREGAYRYVSTKGFSLHEWALDPEDNRDDIKLVKTANPAPWQTMKALRERHSSPSMTPWQWARFACGVWMAGEDAAISEKEWRECAGAPEIPDGESPFIGIDIGRRIDCTAVVAVWRREGEEELRTIPLAIIEPPGDGTHTPEDEIWEPIELAAEKWPQATFVLDPNLGGDIFAERIEKNFPNAQVATFEQVPTALARMAQQLSEAISSKRIQHPDDPGLNAHVLAAGVRQVGERWRFVKQRKKKLAIDGVIALAMAVSTLLGNPEKKTYERAVF